MLHLYIIKLIKVYIIGIIYEIYTFLNFKLYYLQRFSAFPWYLNIAVKTIFIFNFLVHPGKIYHQSLNLNSFLEKYC